MTSPVLWASSVLMLLTGCGAHTVVSAGDPVPTPYSGPMKVPQSFADRASVRERSGAAGLALECSGKPFAGGGADYLESDLYEIGDSAAEALDNYLSGEPNARYATPGEGYQVERENGGRVLLSYDVDGETKVAFVAAADVGNYAGDRGWGIEAWAQCDPAEFPTAVAEDLGFGLWTDERGRTVPTTMVLSQPGPEHCGWDDLTFLYLGGEERGAVYVRDPDGEFEAELTRTTYDDEVVLPADAEDTGYRREGHELWLAADRSAAYVVDGLGAAERLPAAPGVGCE
ncbi:hypothetical protein [Arthrobacter monumenti]